MLGWGAKGKSLRPDIVGTAVAWIDWALRWIRRDPDGAGTAVAWLDPGTQADPVRSRRCRDGGSVDRLGTEMDPARSRRCRDGGSVDKPGHSGGSGAIPSPRWLFPLKCLDHQLD